MDQFSFPVCPFLSKNIVDAVCMFFIDFMMSAVLFIIAYGCDYYTYRTMKSAIDNEY